MPQIKTLADWMQEKGFDQKDVAGLMNCAQSTVSRVLNGQDPTGDFIRAAHRISEGEVVPNSFFLELFEPVAAAA